MVRPEGTHQAGLDTTRLAGQIIAMQVIAPVPCHVSENSKWAARCEIVARYLYCEPVDGCTKPSTTLSRRL